MPFFSTRANSNTWFGVIDWPIAGHALHRAGHALHQAGQLIYKIRSTGAIGYARHCRDCVLSH